MDPKAYYVLMFNTNMDEIETINVPRANQTLDTAAVHALMERIVAVGIVASPKGFAESTNGVDIVVTTYEEIA